MAEVKKVQGVFKTVSDAGLIVVGKEYTNPYVNKDGVQKQGGLTIMFGFVDYSNPQISLYVAKGTSGYDLADSMQLHQIYDVGFKLNNFGGLEIVDYIKKSN